MDYDIHSNADNDIVRTGQKAPWIFFSITLRQPLDNMNPGETLNLTLKNFITYAQGRNVTRVEWIKSGIIIDTLAGDIVYQWMLSETPEIQEILTLSESLADIEYPYEQESQS